MCARRSARNEEEDMTKKIYVGNLPFSATEDQVRDLFSPHGTVSSVNLITDRETGRPRGFGFIEIDGGVEKAISELNDYEMDGRNLKVNEARPREGSQGSRT